MFLQWLRQIPGFSDMRKPGAAVLVLTALVGAAFGAGAGLIEITGSAREPGGLPTATTAVAEAAPPTTVAQEAGFWTAVIASVAIDDGGADSRTAQAVARAEESGHEAFVLDGREYENINDDFLAVCIGRFEDEDEAAALVNDLNDAGFQPQPFTRNVGDRTG